MMWKILSISYQSDMTDINGARDTLCVVDLTACWASEECWDDRSGDGSVRRATDRATYKSHYFTILSLPPQAAVVTAKWGVEHI